MSLFSSIDNGYKSTQWRKVECEHTPDTGRLFISKEVNVTLNDSVVANAVFRLENEIPSVWQIDKDTVQRVYESCMQNTSMCDSAVYRGMVTLFGSCDAIGTLLIVKALLLEASIKALHAVKPDPSMVIGNHDLVKAALANDEMTTLSRDIMTGARRADFDASLVFVLERMYTMADCVSVCNAFSVGAYAHFFRVQVKTNAAGLDVSGLRRVDPRIARRPIICTAKHGVPSETLLSTSSSCVLIQEVEHIDLPVQLLSSHIVIKLSTPFNAIELCMTMTGDETETCVHSDESVPEHILEPMRECITEIAETISRDWGLRRMFLSGEADAVALLPGSDSFARGKEQKLAWFATARFATKTHAAIDGNTLKLHSVCLDRKTELSRPEYALDMRIMQFDVETCNAISCALDNVYGQIKQGKEEYTWQIANFDSYTDRVFNPYAVSLAFIRRHSDERFSRTWKVVAALFVASQSCHGVSFSKSKESFVISDYRAFYDIMLAPFAGNDKLFKRAGKGPSVFSVLGLRVKEYKQKIYTVGVQTLVSEHEFVNLRMFIKIIALVYLSVSGSREGT